MAEVVTRELSERTTLADGTALVDRLRVSSAGTGPWHDGEPMDGRARTALEAAGYADHGHVARQFSVEWFDELDLLVALDRRHQQTLRSLAKARSVEGRLALLRSFDGTGGGAVDIADPFYGDSGDFGRCLGVVLASCRGLVRDLAASLDADPGRAPSTAGRGRDG